MGLASPSPVDFWLRKTVRLGYKWTRTLGNRSHYGRTIKSLCTHQTKCTCLPILISPYGCLLLFFLRHNIKQELKSSSLFVLSSLMYLQTVFLVVFFFWKTMDICNVMKTDTLSLTGSRHTTQLEIYFIGWCVPETPGDHRMKVLFD